MYSVIGNRCTLVKGWNFIFSFLFYLCSSSYAPNQPPVLCKLFLLLLLLSPYNFFSPRVGLHWCFRSGWLEVHIIANTAIKESRRSATVAKYGQSCGTVAKFNANTKQCYFYSWIPVPEVLANAYGTRTRSCTRHDASWQHIFKL